MRRRAQSELTVAIFVMIAVMAAFVLAYRVASHYAEVYRTEATVQQGRAMVNELYEIVKSAGGILRDVKFAVDVPRGSLQFTARRYTANITISTESGTYVAPLIDAYAPIVYYVYGSLPIELSLDDIMCYVVSGPLEFVTESPSEAVVLFEVASQTDYVCGILFVPSLAAEESGSGVATVAVFLPDVEDASVVSSPTIVPNRGVARLSTAMRVTTLSFDFEAPVNATISLTLSAGGLQESVERELLNVRVLRVRIVRVAVSLTGEVP